MKNKNYILFTIGILLITIICFIGIKTNTDYFNNKKDNTKITYKFNETDLADEESLENVYDRVLKIGDTVNIKEIIINKDISSLQYISNSDETVALVQNNQITALSDGKTTITYKMGEEEITLNIEVESAKSNALSNEKSVGQIYFLATQDDKYKANEAVLIKGSNGKYTLIDTSDNVDNSCSKLVKGIQYYAKTTKVTLEYVIISHYHKDHFECYKDLINDTNVEVKNVIMKDTDISHDVYIDLKKASQNKDIKVIKTNGMDEGKYLKLGKTKLYLYNTDDVFKNNKTCYNKIKILKFKSISKISEIDNNYVNEKKENENKNKFIVINGASEDALTTYSSKTARSTKILPDNNKPIIYYARKEKKFRDSCNENSNSIAVLVDFEINGNDHRYAYLPSDLENNGYPAWGAYNKTAGRIIYGSGTSYPYTIKNGVISAGDNIVRNAAEYRTAKDVKIKVGDKNLSKISIYLQTHHGYNNAKDALETLDFDKARPANYPLYAIATNKNSPEKEVEDYLKANSYMNLYKATNNGKNNLASGKYAHGITCNVTVSGATSCIGN